ncbi:MAG: hypothetical protein ACFFAH_10910 [Promethearchaeota archaeon]
MVFSELKKLFTEKEYRLFLVLVLWLLIGFSIFQFKDFIPIWLGYVIFLPLLVICAILFIMSLIFRTNLKELTFKRIVIYCLIAAVIILILFALIAAIFLMLFVLALISYVLITATFYMYSCYRYGIDLDENIHKVEGSGRDVLKWIMFLGGTIISIIIMVILLVIGRFWSKTTGEVQFSFDGMTTVMIVIMIFLLVIGIISLFRGKLNAWLGIFFLFVSVYFLYLMISAYFIITSSGDTTYNFGLRLALYLFDVLLIIYTTTTLIGKKTEVLSEKLKFIKPDGILMWLIFSKAAYEFAKAGLENINIGVFNAIAGLLVFVVLFFIAGLYGIVSYGKREEEPAE